MDESVYVSNDTWVRLVGRPDTIDDIADQFERRIISRADELPTITRRTEPGLSSWPQRSRGWRSMSRLHPRAAQPQSS